MQYFFVLGNNPSLSVAEILAVLSPKSYELTNDQILVVDLDQSIDPQELIARLGGTIKIGIIKEQVTDHFPKILESARGIILAYVKNGVEGKFKFGFSVYHLKIQTKTLGMEIKKDLKQQGLSCRWVISRDQALSSVVVEQNKLVDKGIDLVFFGLNKKVCLGQTLAVQPFKQLSARDYGRPARDDHSGMLPPKLAQIMINLSGTQPGDILLDPFCGSGTVLSEALLMGFEKVIGSDLSVKAIQDTLENLEWIKGVKKIKGQYELHQADVSSLSKVIKKKVDIIVTEPYLGPQRGQVDFRKITQELESLYSKALQEFYKITNDGGRVIMIWPVWLGKKTINPKLVGWSILPMFKKQDFAQRHFGTTERGTIIYGRPQQKVWREIVVLEKK